MSAAQNEVFNIDRHVSIQNGVDATGKRWEIKSTRGSSLVIVRPSPDRADAVIPSNMAGQWTTRAKLQEEIDNYLTASWDKADAANARAERAAQAAKENKLMAIEQIADEEAAQSRILRGVTKEEDAAALADEVAVVKKTSKKTKD
jgi:hypothetical protein